MIELDLPFPPSVNALTFNAKRGRAKTERYNKWLNAAGWELKRQKPGKVKGDYALWLYCERPDRRKRDIDNLVKPVSDLLVSHGVVEDDSNAAEVHLYWCGPGKTCRVRIESAATNIATMPRAA